MRGVGPPVYPFAPFVQHAHVTHDDPDSDEALVALALAGDRAALGALVARWHPGALRLCQRLLGPGPEAEDVAQDAALAACLGLGRLRDPERFGPWLYAIAANLARLSLRRRHARSLEALDEPAGVVTLWSAAAPDPAEVAAMRELHDAVIAALGELSPLSREAVIGFYLEGYSYAELAALLGVPVGTLKGRLVFGRRQLRGRLQAWAPDAAAPPRKAPAMDTPELVPAVIDSVRMDLTSQHRSVVLREAEGGRYLPIFIGPTEADAIAIAMAGQQLPRPMTHDLSLRLLEPLGARVQRVVIRRIADHTFFADVEVRAEAGSYVVDARPSDALALAVRAGAPVLVARAVLDEAGTTEETPNSTTLEPGTPPPPHMTVALVGMEQAEQQAIAGAVLASSPHLMGVHLLANAGQVLAMTSEPGRRGMQLAVIDLADEPEARLNLVAALRAKRPTLPIVALGGEAAAARAAGATAHVPRPIDVESLRKAVRDAAVAAEEAEA